MVSLFVKFSKVIFVSILFTFAFITADEKRTKKKKNGTPEHHHCRTSTQLTINISANQVKLHEKVTLFMFYLFICPSHPLPVL